MASCNVTDISADRVFVFGDLHGCPDEPELLLGFLTKEEGLADGDAVVFLGDYIDRGPGSKNVIELLIDFRTKHPQTFFIKGNHEDMLLDFLGFGGRMGQAFLYNGGLETVQSYGISVFAPPEEMVHSIPEAHVQFFSELLSILTIGEFICVHAGLNPLRDLSHQNNGDVFWIRDEFIASVHSFERLVVFGHTPYRDVLVHAPYKVGIDTGLVFGNKLSCLELKSGALFQVNKGGKSVNRSELVLTAAV